MIQRIQTIFMFLFIAVGAVNFFFFPSEEMVFAPLLGDHVDFIPYVSLILAFVVLINLFLYRKRLLQIRINQIVWLFYTFFWGYFVYLALQTDNLSHYLPDLLLAFLGEVSLLLANRNIRKDEALVRSLDRLR